MIYVYSRYIDSGKENFVSSYEKWADAIEKIRSLYNMDSKSAMKGQFYYFAKER